MVRVEARQCYSRSKAYHGRCFFKNQITNCREMCKEESFTTGRCIRGTCYCSETCDSPGTHQSHSPPSGGDDDDDGGDDGDV